MAKRANDDPIHYGVVQLDRDAYDEEEFDETVQRRWEEVVERLGYLRADAEAPERVMSIAIHWYTGSAFNHGRIGDTGIRIERYNVGTKTEPAWRFMLADDEITYLHVDDREFATREELEQAAVRWLVDAGRLSWLQ